MKGYKVYNECRFGCESDVFYTSNKNKAIKLFNDALRKEFREVDVISKEDFGAEVQETREYNKDYNLVCRSYPVIIFESKDCSKLRGHIPFWENTSYEYNEYEVCSNSIILEEIEIIE